MLSLDNIRDLEMGDGLDDGDGGEYVTFVGVEKRRERVAAKCGGTPWSRPARSSKLVQIRSHVIFITREQSCS